MSDGIRQPKRHDHSGGPSSAEAIELLRRNLHKGLEEAKAGQLLNGEEVFRLLVERARQIESQARNDS